MIMQSMVCCICSVYLFDHFPNVLGHNGNDVKGDLYSYSALSFSSSERFTASSFCAFCS